MTVGAAYGAFIDFALDCTPRQAALEHGTDVHALLGRMDVVEIEHHRIGFAAVDARVGQQILEYASV
jgi:hypothetical protein